MRSQQKIRYNQRLLQYLRQKRFYHEGHEEIEGKTKSYKSLSNKAKNNITH